MSSPNPPGEATALATVSSTPPVTIPTKYAAAIFPFVLTILWAFQTYIVGGISEVEIYQLLGLVAGTALIRLLPLLQGGWAAALKILGSVAAAVFAAIPPIIDVANGGPGWTAETISTVVFTGVLALATQFGVDFRVDAMKKALVDPAIDNTEVYVLDPGAYRVAEQTVPTRQAEPSYPTF